MRLRIGFFSQTKVLGGSEVYLRLFLLRLDHQKYTAVFFCNSAHPLLADKEINVLINKGQIVVVIVREDAPAALVEGTVPVGGGGRKGSTLKACLVKTIPSSFKLFLGTIRELRHYAGLFRANPVDLLYFNDTGCEPPVIAARMAGVSRIIGTYHVLPDEERKTWVHCLIEWFSVRSMHMGIAVSGATKKAWVSRTGVCKERIRVIYNGIDFSSFIKEYDLASIKRELGVPEDKKIIGVPARLHPMKGHQYLLEAISKKKADLSDTVFLFIGDGGLRESLEASAEKLSISGIVRFLGHRSDVPRILSILDLVVLPSVALEALPFALIEAQASGKAVVASDFSGIPEIVENGVTGVLVPSMDSNALADAILKLLHDPELRRSMGEKGRERAKRLFSIDRMLQETFQVYDDLLNGIMKMKVALLSSGLGHVKRGVETWTEDMGNALVARGIDVVVYKGGGCPKSAHEKVVPCIERAGSFSKWIMRYRPGFMWRFGFGNGYSLEEMTFCWNLLPELLVRQFDIIHTQDPDVALFCQKLRDLKFIRSRVILGHGTEEPFDVLKKLEYIQHLAPFHLQEALAHGVTGKKGFAVGNFVETDVFKPGQTSLRAELGIPADAFVVLSVAAIKKAHKRIDHLISEVASLGNTNVYLLVAGSKVDGTEELIQDAKMALGERAIFLTDFPRERIPSLYATGDIFALCSLKEMMPIALLEALASGLPCLVHQYPVEEWMIGDGGESIDMSKAGVLSKAIQKYLNFEYRKEKAQRARVQAVKSFSKEVVLSEVLKMYKDVL